MRMPDNVVQRQAEEEEEVDMMPVEQLSVQRKCEGCDREEKEQLQRKPLCEEITPVFQRKQAAGRGVSAETAASLKTGKSSGRALPEETQKWMESRFGTGFSGVKVHTGSQSDRLNRKLNARAFTHGSDIWFRNGTYTPDTIEGKRLIAHELTHVVQQRSGMKRIQREDFDTTIHFRERLFSRYFRVPRGNSLKLLIDSHRSPENCSLPTTYRVYLYNTREKRYEATVTYSVDSRESYVWKGLPAGTYQFIFLMEGAAERCYLDGSIEVRQTEAVDNILPVIRGHIGSTEWAYTADRPPGANTNKCNQYVYEALNEAGAAVPMMQRRRFGIRRPDHPPLAGQWADSSVSISGWEVVSTPQPGDIAAEAIEYSDASGHVGIVSTVNEDGTGTTISATSDSVVENDWGFREGQNVTYRRYQGR